VSETYAQVGAKERIQASLVDIRRRVDEHLGELFDTKLLEEGEAGGRSALGLSQLRNVALSGGKRIRPAFTHWGFMAAGGDPADDRAIRAGSVFELLHAFALIHDDVMDESDTRRSMPTLHVSFSKRHNSLGMRGSAQRYGENMAILLGDFMLLMCTELAASLPPRAQWAFYRAANQLMHGQYLDLETSASGDPGWVPAATTALLKTAGYTVEAPLLIRTALTPRGTELERFLRPYGRAVGQAFQHRDDMLDIFGDGEEVGKPIGGDMVQHKATRLLEIARELATGADRTLLRRLDGSEANDIQLDVIRSLLLRCGSVAEMEAVIDELIHEATTTIAEAPMAESGREMLIDAAYFVGQRKW